MKLLDKIQLKKGAHTNRKEGLCAMEAVAWIAGEKHTDAPGCACPMLSIFVRKLNDSWTDEERQLLKPYLVRLLNTRDGKALKRAKLLAIKSVCNITPHAIELKFPAEAQKMRNAKTLRQAKSAADAAARAASYADYAGRAASYAADAADAAARAASYAAYSADARKKIIQECLDALNEAINL